MLPNASTSPAEPSGQAATSSPGSSRAPRMLFTLAELDPQWVIAGERTGAGYRADDVVSSGAMREQCPSCFGLPLQLVLRHARVIRTHLFCPNCTRCFDAIYPDGSSALMPLSAPIN